MFRTALLAAAVMVGLTAAPAMAEPDVHALARHFSGSKCPADSLCLYKDRDFKGGGVAFKTGAYLPSLNNVQFNDQMSSWSNDSGGTCYWYSDDDGKGAAHDMKNGYRVNVLSSENDTASSVRC
jgi:hypothetical protein